LPVDNITFFILEVPRDEDITFTDPGFLFDLSLDSPPHCHAVKTADTNMVLHPSTGHHTRTSPGFVSGAVLPLLFFFVLIQVSDAQFLAQQKR
jgi:hypothetical protein